jgi:predicted RNA-binding protein with PIN domain
MRWLIDGYNVIRRDPDLRAAEQRALEAGRSDLLRLVAGAAVRTGDPFTVVFDGALIRGGGASPGQVQVIFSRPPKSADDVLIELAVKYRAAAVVVSSDRTVQNAARRAGSITLSADAFLEALDAPGEPSEDDETDAQEYGHPPSKHGNPRRLSKDARGVARALRRLRGRRA